MDLGVGDAGRTDRGGVLSDTADWLAATFGHQPRDPALFTRALTHGSHADPSFERLEFLGDRVLGLVIAQWLVELFPAEPEGALTRRLHVLVSGATCAVIAREIGAGAHLRLGKQAQDDGAHASDHVLGDVVEALLAALYLDAGMAAAEGWVRARWAGHVHRVEGAAKHPKAALQDWALVNNRGMPVYTLVDQTGPDHARRHTVSARLGDAQEVAVATTKREAEAEAARLLMARILADAAGKPGKRTSRPRTVVKGPGAKVLGTP